MTARRAHVCGRHRVGGLYHGRIVLSSEAGSPPDRTGCAHAARGDRVARLSMRSSSQHREPRHSMLRTTPSAMSNVRLGLRENLGQFTLLVVVNAFVGAMPTGRSPRSDDRTNLSVELKCASVDVELVKNVLARSVQLRRTKLRRPLVAVFVRCRPHPVLRDRSCDRDRSVTAYVFVVCGDPYTCDFSRGIIGGLANRLDPAAKASRDNNAPCRKLGADSCTYIVWRPMVPAIRCRDTPSHRTGATALGIRHKAAHRLPLGAATPRTARVPPGIATAATKKEMLEERVA